MIRKFITKIDLGGGASESDKKAFIDKFQQRAKLPSKLRTVNESTVKSKTNRNTKQSTPISTTITPTMDDGAIAKIVQDNVAATPATVTITPKLEDGAIAMVVTFSSRALISCSTTGLV